LHKLESQKVFAQFTDVADRAPNSVLLTIVSGCN
jgi:hypothetical protein